MSNAILQAIKDGSIFKKIHHRFRLYYLKDDYPINLVEQCNDYKSLKKRYYYILEKDLDKDKFTHVKDNSISKKIWICWFQGFANAPEVIKMCVNSIKKNAGNNEVILLDDTNIRNYVQFPDYIEKKYKNGIISKAHYSDLIRLQLICKYGGAWIDSTVLCTSSSFIEYALSLPLFVLRNTDYTKDSQAPSILSNWFIAGQPNQRILLKTQELLLEYWKNENKTINYYIFHLFFTMATRIFSEDWSEIPVFDNHAAHILRHELENDFDRGRWEQIVQMSPLHKLTHHIEINAESEKSIINVLKKKYGEHS